VRNPAASPLLWLAVLVAWVSPSEAQRLPDTVAPDHYTLWFAPDLANATFRGRESIRVTVRRPVREITLHAAEIQFDEVSIEAAGLRQPAQVTLDTPREMATLSVPREIPAGPAIIHIAYRGLLNDKLRGFYLSHANGRRYAVTQMEATDARRAFPSFDEPALKATFELSLMVDTVDSAISNGAQISDTPGPEPGKHTVSFAPTPRMSTYLVAMIVGDFVCRSGAADGTPIRVCSTPDKLPLTGFALEAAEQQLAFYNRYFGIRYPFGKLDIIAVPDFAAGAMENAGAITFRERRLLLDPARASLDTRKGVAGVISHEIAHQWFGNLVTMQWWNDIWLNEGFATWIASKPIARWRPEWKVEADDAADTQGALSIDALRSTRAIRIAVETPDEINQVFDGIAYEKTAGVLRMIEAYVGPDAFRDGVRAYLKAHAFSNAAGEDFWQTMTAATGRPVDRIMRGFVERPGAPVLSVEPRCDGGRSRITVTQARFTGVPGAAAPERSPWAFPVCVGAGGRGARCELLEEPQRTFTAPSCNPPAFANAGARGFYFTEYTPDAVRALARPAARLSPVERISLLSDEWWMVRAGRHDIGVYLDLATALAADESAAIIETMAPRLSFTGEYLVSSEMQGRYRAWIRNRFGPPLDALGLPGAARDADERQSRRAELLGLVAGTGGDAETRRRARELAERYLTDTASLPASLAPVVLRMAAFSGDTALYDRYVARLGTLASDPDEYSRFFNALASFEDPALVQRTLAFALSPAVRAQDTGTLIAGLLSRAASREAAWAFVQTQWTALSDKLGTFQGIPTIVGALGAFCSTEHAGAIRQFFTGRPVPAATRALQQALERIETCALVSERQAPALTAWLSARP
jgi:aminopeptidase N